MKGRAGMFALALLAAARGGLAGQEQDDPFARGRSEAGVALDSAVVAVTLHPGWRGLLLGTSAARVFVDVALAGQPVTATGAWGLAGNVHGMLLGDERPGLPTLWDLGGGLVVSRHFGGGDGPSLALAVDGYHLPYEEASESGVELGLALRDVTWHWGLEEVDPRITLAVYRDLGAFDAFRVDAGANVGLGIQNVAFWGARDVAGWIEARGGWSDYEAPHAIHWRAGLGLAVDWGLLALSASGGVFDPLDASVRGWAELGLRAWPDGRAR